MKKVFLPDDLHQALKIEAVRRGVTLQDWIAAQLQLSLGATPASDGAKATGKHGA